MKHQVVVPDRYIFKQEYAGSYGKGCNKTLFVVVDAIKKKVSYQVKHYDTYVNINDFADAVQHYNEL